MSVCVGIHQREEVTHLHAFAVERLGVRQGICLISALVASFRLNAQTGHVLLEEVITTLKIAARGLDHAGSIWKKIKQHHMLHHYQAPDRGYGVSSPLWDKVFGSDFEKK